MNINQWLADHPVACRYGAPLGDFPDRGDPSTDYKFHLQKIQFVDGDYDRAGTYWGGSGCPRAKLWGFMCDHEEDGLVRGFVRAANRLVAKVRIRDEYPNARFYR